VGYFFVSNAPTSIWLDLPRGHGELAALTRLHCCVEGRGISKAEGNGKRER